jgi:hypothetical protein|tara:strand:+ start:443 stop:625 length:183 start_codon:yes stop_codon:yes gene_type:complete
MKIHEITNETATSGGTSAGAVASVANPTVARSKKKPKMQKPTDNALNKNTNLFTGTTLKR